MSPAHLELFRELCDLKRIHSADRAGSLAARLFAAGWSALLGPDDPHHAMLRTVAAARLGDLDLAKLTTLGLDRDEAVVVLERAFDEVAAALDPALAADLRAALSRGLALLDAHWNAPATAFELACGIGRYLHELTTRGVACTGADVVFSKCWLAKHWVAPDAEYLVFDATAPWPIAGARFDLVMCHNAFYFLPEQARNAERLRGAVSPGGTLAISRVHNGEYHAGVKGPPMTADSCSGLFPEAAVYSEDDLYWSLVRADRPWPHDWSTINRLETKAFSMIEGGPPAPRKVAGGVAMPLPGAKLRPNPLLGPDGARWPSQRYGAEYEENSLWAFKEDELEPRDWINPVRLRRLVDPSERW